MFGKLVNVESADLCSHSYKWMVRNQFALVEVRGVIEVIIVIDITTVTAAELTHTLTRIDTTGSTIDTEALTMTPPVSLMKTDLSLYDCLHQKIHSN